MSTLLSSFARPFASLVWDGGDDVFVPKQMGQAKKNQLIGTPAERLTELCGRGCYDSLGQGRSSVEYHEHIAEVKHGSVWEHHHVTVEIESNNLLEDAMCFLNRPGAWVREFASTGKGLLIATVNLRTVVEWFDWNRVVAPQATETSAVSLLGAALQQLVWGIAPQIIKRPYVDRYTRGSMPDMRLIAPGTGFEHEQEPWVAMYLEMSRGCSHELVRHGDFTAISQRSTRYIQESETPYVIHPLLTAYIEEVKAAESVDSGEPWGEIAEVEMDHTVETSRNTYNAIVDSLQPWLLSRGVDKLTARKQARGAARDFLGNGLFTSMIFSASVWEWKTILRQRLHPAADGTIRELAAHMLRILKESRYGERFMLMGTEPSPDGIGVVLVEESAV